MKYFIFRNSTLENIFRGENFKFSDYNDIINIDKSADSYIWFYLLPINSNQTLVSSEVSTYLSSVELILSNISHDKIFYVFTLEKFAAYSHIQGDYYIEEAIFNFNLGIKKLEGVYPNLRVLNFGNFTNKFDNKTLIDWKYFFVSKIQLNPRLHNKLYGWFEGQISSINYLRKKCLVVDLDNTLWGGVLGEDGMFGIQIGGDYPGNAYLYFQERLIQLLNSGVILAICSKNNFEDVEDAFKLNKNILIGFDDFVVKKINWENKAQNIAQIADELNIGLDSIVFIDDSHSEVALIEKMIPEVSVKLFPDQPYLIPTFLDELFEDYFKVYSLTKEDLVKTDSYKKNIERNREISRYSDVNDYLKSLQIILKVDKINDSSLGRSLQLINKTNQFNLTTYRFTENELVYNLKNGFEGYTLTYEDKFGSNGITGLILYKKIGLDSAEIDVLLLSCRVLGKKVELGFLKFILSKLKNDGINKVIGKYISSPKNSQVADFYEKVGFLYEKKQNDINYYYVDLTNFDFEKISDNNYKII